MFFTDCSALWDISASAGRPPESKICAKSSAFGGNIPRQIAAPHPRTAIPFIPNFISPVGGAEPFFCKGIVSMPARQGPTFVRAKVGKTRSRGTDSSLTNPFPSLAVLDTNDAGASSVLRTDTLSRCLRRILFGPSRNRIKNQPYKRRLAPDPEGRRPSGRGVPTRYGSLGRSPE